MDTENFSTKDIYTAASLHYLGFPLDRVDKQGPTYYFQFKKDPTGLWSFKQAVDAYWQGDLNIPAIRYVDSLKQLKSRMNRERIGV